MQNERTLKMKREFMTLHEQGFSVKDIAKKFDLNPVTVYANLSDIAKANGCTRESLLRQVHQPPLTYDRQFMPVKEVDVGKYQAKFSSLRKAAKELSNMMAEYVEQEDKI
ncbi:MAG: hypothetical protein Q4A36_00065 [Candidatus Saccharibacteria bacterium]|nr:hypothetical protein [Candidatus Saccharibacteria bacterium]